ncbi:hypothetical protein KP509_36G065600 [Ceratopteris richardii]|uniref:C2H2-type domain-containing protein n=1 Tax=Ceratopteris richardii TaxID=49495 RepID=A0A8T2QDS7_CERRI|nr:hypothetical protein KP509_36G065600 [Ceratopteris richardii]
MSKRGRSGSPRRAGSPSEDPRLPFSEDRSYQWPVHFRQGSPHRGSMAMDLMAPVAWTRNTEVAAAGQRDHRTLNIIEGTRFADAALESNNASTLHQGKTISATSTMCSEGAAKIELNYASSPVPCWATRSYGCIFCGREFNSAQALGGHMNIHRRDRARLRSSVDSPPHRMPGTISPCQETDASDSPFSSTSNAGDWAPREVNQHYFPFSATAMSNYRQHINLTPEGAAAVGNLIHTQSTTSNYTSNQQGVRKGPSSSIPSQDQKLSHPLTQSRISTSLLEEHSAIRTVPEKKCLSSGMSENEALIMEQFPVHISSDRESWPRNTLFRTSAAKKPTTPLYEVDRASKQVDKGFAQRVTHGHEDKLPRRSEYLWYDLQAETKEAPTLAPSMSKASTEMRECDLELRLGVNAGSPTSSHS